MDTRRGELSELIAALRETGTDLHDVEVKSAVGGVPKDLWPTISAFSNRGGGTIILGLEEKNGFLPAAGFDAPAVRDALTTCFRPRKSSDGEGQITPRPLGTVDIAQVDGDPVVVAEVEELPSESKPAFVTTKGKERGTYERVGDADIQLGTYEVFLLSTEGAQSTFDTEPVDGTSADHLDDAQIDRFISRLKRRRPRAVNDLTSTIDILRRHGIVAPDSATPTTAGLLAFGTYPQEFFRQGMVTFAVYPGATKSSVLDSTRMLDRRVIEGPIPVMVEDTVNAVAQNLRHRRVIHGAGASDEPEIPLEVIREAVTNALAHRDYSPLGLDEQVLVEMFPDRVEITNPGTIWGGRSVVDLYDGSSRSRNRTLANLLTDVLLPDKDEAVSENAGSGLPRMAGLLGRAGLAAPKITNETSHVRVTLDRHGLLTPEVEAWLRTIGAGSLSADLQRTLALIHNDHDVDAHVLRAQLAIDTDDARRLLQTLVDRGWLRYPLRSGEPYRRGEKLAKSAASDQLPIDDESLDVSPLPSLDVRIITTISENGELGARQLSEALDVPVTTLRSRLRVLVDQKVLHPTAGPKSRKRKYQLGDVSAEMLPS